MKHKKKVNIFGVFVIALVIIIAAYVLSRSTLIVGMILSGDAEPTTAQIEKMYQGVGVDIRRVSQFILNEFSEDDIYVDADDTPYTYFHIGSGIEQTETVKYDNMEMERTISALFTVQKCKSISKFGDCVLFLFWSDLDDGSGFLYVPDEKSPPKEYDGIIVRTLRMERGDSIYYYETDLKDNKQDSRDWD